MVKTDDGLEAVIFTAQGDMRQAINNLQATHQVWGVITFFSSFYRRNLKVAFRYSHIPTRAESVGFNGAPAKLQCDAVNLFRFKEYGFLGVECPFLI